MVSRALVLFACALLLVAPGIGQSLYMRTNGSCTVLEYDECTSCTANGETTYLKASYFDDGEVSCGIYPTAECGYAETYQWTRYTPCFALADCEVAPSDFLLLSVWHPSSLNVTTLSDRAYAVSSMSGASAVVAGRLESLLFRSEDSRDRLVFLERYDDGSFLTNLGVCSLDQSCTLGAFTVSATEMSPFVTLTAREREVALLMTGTSPAEELVHIEVADFYAVSVPEGNATVIFGDEGPTVTESGLSAVHVSIPLVEFSDMQLKDTDQSIPDIAAKMTVKDFATYIDGLCHRSSVSGDFWSEPILNCGFSPEFSLDWSALFSNFISSLSLDDANERQPWEEKTAFSLFE